MLYFLRSWQFSPVLLYFLCVRRGFLVVFSVLLLSYSSSKYFLTSVKRLTSTSFKNCFCNPLQNAKGSILFPAHFFNNYLCKQLMMDINYTDFETGYWKPLQAFWSGLLNATSSILGQVTDILFSIHKRVTNYFYLARMKTTFLSKPLQKNLWAATDFPKRLIVKAKNL